MIGGDGGCFKLSCQECKSLIKSHHPNLLSSASYLQLEDYQIQFHELVYTQCLIIGKRSRKTFYYDYV